jgi:putative addiction module component (TIGR02574 family)
MPIARLFFPEYPSQMATIVEVEKLALDLPERQRATLAANLLESLPAILSDEDEGIAEALRRDTDLDADPDRAISLEQLDSQIRARRG